MSLTHDSNSGGGPDLVVDDGGDATLLIHEGVKAKEEYEKSGKFPDVNGCENGEFRIVLRIIKDGLLVDPTRYRRMKKMLVGVSEETTTGLRGCIKCKLMGPCCFLPLMSMTLSLRARYALFRNDDDLDFEFLMKGYVFMLRLEMEII